MKYDFTHSIYLSSVSKERSSVPERSLVIKMIQNDRRVANVS